MTSNHGFELRARRPRRLFAVMVVLLGVVVVGLASAAADGESSTNEDQARVDPFVSVEDADPMELGRVVERLGDDAVLARLRPKQPVVVRLAAARAARWMHAPELALEPLARMASGRDPHLAPVAAQAAWGIAQRLNGVALTRREVLPRELTRARKRLQDLAEDGTARADLRRLAQLAVGALEAAGIPGSGGAD